MSELRKRQHYVWRYYLAPWTKNGSIWCNRLGNVFNSGLMSVGQEKYFYEISLLSDEESDFIKSLFLNDKRPHLQGIVDTIVDCFHIPTYFHRLVSALNSHEDPEAKQILRELTVNTHEKLLCSIENMAKEFLPQLQDGNIDFLTDDESRNLFMLHLCFQYLRTKRMKNNFLASNFDHVNAHYDGHIRQDNLWGVISVVFSFQTGMGIYALLPKYHFKIIHNTSAINFITGDQPVINIAESGRPHGQEPKELVFYHPISPRVALFMSRSFDCDSSVDVDDDGMVEEYNKVIASEALEQIYGSSKKDVSKYTVEPDGMQGTRHKWRIP